MCRNIKDYYYCYIEICRLYLPRPEILVTALLISPHFKLSKHLKATISCELNLLSIFLLILKPVIRLFLVLNKNT